MLTDKLKWSVLIAVIELTTIIPEVFGKFFGSKCKKEDGKPCDNIFNKWAKEHPWLFGISSVIIFIFWFTCVCYCHRLKRKLIMRNIVANNKENDHPMWGSKSHKKAGYPGSGEISPAIQEKDYIKVKPAAVDAEDNKNGTAAFVSLDGGGGEEKKIQKQDCLLAEELLQELQLEQQQYKQQEKVLPLSPPSYFESTNNTEMQKKTLNKY